MNGTKPDPTNPDPSKLNPGPNQGAGGDLPPSGTPLDNSVFDRVPEARRARGEAEIPDLDPKSPDPKGERLEDDPDKTEVKKEEAKLDETAEEKEAREKEEAEAEAQRLADEKTGAEAPPEEQSAWAKAMIDEAVAKVRTEELDPLRQELHRLKSDEGRARKEESEQIRAEHETFQREINQEMAQASTDVGSRLINVIRAIQGAQENEQGQLIVTDTETGEQALISPNAIGEVLLQAAGVSQSLMHKFGQGQRRIIGQVEAALFKRRPELTKYKDQFAEQVKRFGGNVQAVQADLAQTEAYYDAMQHADIAATLPEIKKQNLEAVQRDKERKKAAQAPAPRATQPARPETQQIEAEKKKGRASLGVTGERPDLAPPLGPQMPRSRVF